MASTLNLLAVDDEERVRDRIRDIVAQIQGDWQSPGSQPVRLNLQFASTKREAQQKIRRSYFHVALVDLHLGASARSRADGCDVLEFLRRNRPSCRRIAMTDKTDRDLAAMATEEIFRVTSPSEPLCSGLINKASNFDVLESSIARVTRELAYAPLSWRDRDLREIVARVRNKVVQPSGDEDVLLSFTAAEVEAVMTALFGRAERRSMSFAGLSHSPVDFPGVSDEFSSREVRLLQFSVSGRSRSVVCFVRPEVVRGLPGAVVAVKVASRRDALEETRRYNLFMRFGARHAARPDLLTSALGDSVGALGYSFGGSYESETVEPSVPSDLGALVRSLLIANDDQREELRQRVLGVAARVVGPESTYWYGRTFSLRQSMLELVSTSFGLDLDDAVSQLELSAIEVSQTLGVTYSSRRRGERSGVYASLSELQISGFRSLPVPSRRFFRNHPIGQGGKYTSCIVHGDLNLSNILMLPDGPDVMVIDFRYTGIGPRLYDFAALGVHYRLLEAEELAAAGSDLSRDSKALQEAAEAERFSWDTGDLHAERRARLPESALFSRELLRLAVDVFHIGGDEVQIFRQEYWLTTIFYALRLLSLKTVRSARRARLLVLISVLFDLMGRSDPAEGSHV